MRTMICGQKWIAVQKRTAEQLQTMPHQEIFREVAAEVVLDNGVSIPELEIASRGNYWLSVQCLLDLELGKKIHRDYSLLDIARLHAECSFTLFSRRNLRFAMSKFYYQSHNLYDFEIWNIYVLQA